MGDLEDVGSRLEDALLDAVRCGHHLGAVLRDGEHRVADSVESRVDEGEVVVYAGGGRELEVVLGIVGPESALGSDGLPAGRGERDCIRLVIVRHLDFLLLDRSGVLVVAVVVYAERRRDSRGGNLDVLRGRSGEAAHGVIDDLDRGICRHIDDRAVGIRLLVCPDVPGTVGSLRLHLQHAERGAALEGDRVH